MAPISRSREYISLAVVAAVLVAALFVVRAYADSIKEFIDQHAFWGLFTDIGWSKYLTATAIGLTTSAFLLAYLGKLPNAYEIIAFGVGGVLLAGSLLVARRKRKATQHT